MYLRRNLKEKSQQHGSQSLLIAFLILHFFLCKIVVMGVYIRKRLLQAKPCERVLRLEPLHVEDAPHFVGNHPRPFPQNILFHSVDDGLF